MIKNRIFSPDTYQYAWAWAYRIFHSFYVGDSKKYSIYCVLKEGTEAEAGEEDPTQQIG